MSWGLFFRYVHVHKWLLFSIWRLKNFRRLHTGSNFETASREYFSASSVLPPYNPTPKQFTINNDNQRRMIKGLQHTASVAPSPFTKLMEYCETVASGLLNSLIDTCADPMISIPSLTRTNNSSSGRMVLPNASKRMT